jgi:glycosyltransferase involved in cell wall biosynthesis
MKIVFLTGQSNNLTGGMRVISIYADLLKKRGHDVVVVSPSPTKVSVYRKIRSVLKGEGFITNKRSGPSHFDNIDVPCIVLSHEAPITSFDLPDADVVIATYWITAEWVASLPPSKGAKVYFIQGHETHEHLPIDRVMATYRLPLYKITISKWLTSLLETKYDCDQISLVPNSVDFDQFQASPRDTQPIPTVGMLYSTKHIKGCDISLKAYYKVRKKIKNLQLIAFGSEYPSKDLPLPKDTTFFYQPAQNTIKDIYSMCDIWLFGSRLEGFGLPILEAMACRTPVIATPAGAAPELISTGGGILIKHDSAEDMAKAIQEIYSLPNSEWRLMSDAAYAQAAGYSWEDATDMFEKSLLDAVECDSLFE